VGYRDERDASPNDWGAQLPANTRIIRDTNTVRPIREIVELMRDATTWQTKTLPYGGHMAPLTHPEQVNPIVAEFLQDRRLMSGSGTEPE
jgi:pimeloyl-ACP methyl ester carboxylesterase